MNPTILTTKRFFAQKSIVYMIHIVLVLLSLLAILKSIFVSFDIDEGYAIAQSYRLIKGDRLFDQMWEPHQLSAFFSAIFMFPFLEITGGNTTGIVIYLRIVGTLIHLLIGFWLYFVARKRFAPTLCIMITLVHINFLPKWVSTPEFELMHYWAVCVLFLALLSWNKDKSKKRYLILSSIALFVAMMCYPTMIILYPIYVVAILHFTRQDNHVSWSAIFWFTLPVFILGIAFIGYLRSYMSFSELFENISYILMDESHSNSLGYRFREYWDEITTFLFQLLFYLGISFLLVCTMKKILAEKGKECTNSAKIKVRIMLILTVMMLSINQLVSSVLGDANQFYLYFRFLAVVFLGLSCASYNKKENLEYILFGILPGLFSILASAAITNMTLEIALARIYIGVISSCFIIANWIRTFTSKDIFLRGLIYTGSVFFLLSLLMCKLLLVRVTGCIPISIKMHMDQVTDGPAAGLLLKEELAEIYNENTVFLQANVTEGDRLLIFGCENIYYLISGAQIASPSTQGTSVFNELYLQYYELHPEKLPNVVVLDKTFETNPDYNYSQQNRIMLEWIMEEFKNAEIVEYDNLILFRK